jgi:hypothetical protein
MMRRQPAAMIFPARSLSLTDACGTGILDWNKGIAMFVMVRDTRCTTTTCESGAAEVRVF